MSDWYVYRGTSEPHDGITELPPPPPWRSFGGAPMVELDHQRAESAESYRPAPETVELVNAAMILRRPILVTGRPGTGKSSLARAIAHELRLGPVLYWPITSRVTRRDGLYQYDPLTRLYEVNRMTASREADSQTTSLDDAEPNIGDYIRLGPLGTALLPLARPRVLLIDEIDKSDIDLPNDLLTVFETGEYEIPELVRIAHLQPTSQVMVAGSGTTQRVEIHLGLVRCNEFPIVVMTSNGEREFPPAFLRRCINLRLDDPDEDRLRDIVRSHLDEFADSSEDLIAQFLDRRSRGELATDQLLNAIYLTHVAGQSAELDRAQLAERVMPYLSTRIDLDDD
jgi:MoxR-like ATPase